MKLLVITNLFPNRRDADRGIFNKQQFQELAKHCALKVVAPLPAFGYRADQVPAKEVIEGIEVFHPRYFVIPKILRSLYGWFFYRGIKKCVEKTADAFSFDVILATWAYPDAFAAALIARKFNKPLYVKVHGSDINILSRYRLRRRMICFALNRAEKIIAVSEDLKNKIVALGIPERKIAVIQNGIDTTIFKPMNQKQCRVKLSLPQDKKIVLYVGHLQKVKGVDILVESMRHLSDQVRLVVLGEGRMKNALLAKVSEYHLNDKVFFAGAAQHADVPVWLNAADVFCLPSRQEGCPNVVLEALACGKNIVASNTGGIPQLISSEKQGLLVEPENVTALSNGLKKMLQQNGTAVGKSSPPYSWQDNAHDLFCEIKEGLQQKNILYHHRTQGRGAEGVHVREVIKGMRGLGHHVEIVSPPGVDAFSFDAAMPKQLQKTGSSLRKIVKQLPQFVFEILEMGYSLWAERQLTRVVRAQRIDFIYERYAFFCSAGVRVAQKFNIPFILEVNEISGIKRQRGQTFVKLCSQMEIRILARADHVIVVSGFLKQQLVGRGIDQKKISVISNAVNPREFFPRKKDRALVEKYNLKDKTVVMFVGVFSRWDSLELLIRSFAEIYRQNQNIHLMLVGDGQQRGTLEKNIKNLGIEDAVSITGFCGRPDIPRYISLADICVLAGSNPFGSPIALFEYMAMGKAVIAPRYDPIAQIIDSQTDGLLFNPENKRAFTDELEKLFQSPNQRQTLGENACRKIKQNYTWRRNAHKILEIYNNVFLSQKQKNLVSKNIDDKYYSSFPTVQSEITCQWLGSGYARLLEIGCSSGYLTKKLSRKSEETYGLDINKEHIDIAQKNYPDIHFQAVAADTLPYADNFFDVVVMLEVYEHVDDREKTMQEVHRILKPGGTLILSTPNTGLFAFLDAFNLKMWFLQNCPALTRGVSRMFKKYDVTQYTDNLTWHGHYSLSSVKQTLGNQFVVQRVHRGGLLLFPLCSILRAVLLRTFPSRFIIKCVYAVMNFEGMIRFGPLAYNLVIQARKQP